MNDYKGIIFDLDGTLLDTLSDLANSVNKVLLHYHFPVHANDVYKKKIGKGFKDLLTRSMPENTPESIVEEGLSLFLEIYDQDYMKTTKPYPGIVELLHTLQAKGVKLAINSNKRNDYTNSLVKKNFPDIEFVGCFGERKNIPKKPDPTAAFELRNMMMLKCSEVLYVGDSKTDMQTAENANMDSIGVLWGFRDKEELQDYHATYIVKDAKEIESIINNQF
ncbi:hydrolase [Erysipelotrichaceae bacterium MTC7]|nr:hydrolase [Erysipelotrichaceae bacterium MTC7]